jgi:phytol kinase
LKNVWGILLVLGTLGAVMMLLRIVRARFGLHPELSRKIVHVSMGLVVLAFPWLFDRTWPVIGLAIAAVAFLLAIRWHPVLHAYLGPVLAAVPRQSFGEVYFPLGAAVLFVLARGDAVLFCIPILILTLGDAVGALIGLRYGRARFRTDEGFKSAEGSLAFFFVAFLSTHVPLLLFTDVGRAESLLIGFVLGFLAMLAEAVAWRGLDNLFIPLGSFFVLDISLHHPASDLVLRVVVMLALTGVYPGHSAAHHSERQRNIKRRDFRLPRVGDWRLAMAGGTDDRLWHFRGIDPPRLQHPRRARCAGGDSCDGRSDDFPVARAGAATA